MKGVLIVRSKRSVLFGVELAQRGQRNWDRWTLLELQWTVNDVEDVMAECSLMNKRGCSFVKVKRGNWQDVAGILYEVEIPIAPKDLNYKRPKCNFFRENLDMGKRQKQITAVCSQSNNHWSAFCEKKIQNLHGYFVRNQLKMALWKIHHWIIN